MITSIIPLPNFHSPWVQNGLPATPVLGQYSNVITNEVYELQGITFTEGRNLVSPIPLFKYKLEMIVNDPSFGIINQPYYMVIVCNDEIDTITMSYTGKFNSGSQFIAPIYARGLGHTYMFTNGVNNLLSYLGYTTDRVMSVKGFIGAILHALGDISRDVLDVDADIADVALSEPLSQITDWFASGNCRTGDIINHLDGRYFSNRRTLPSEVHLIRTFTQLDQLKLFINPYVRNIDEVHANVIRTMPTWPSIQSDLIARGALLSRSVDCDNPVLVDDIGRMAKLLQCIMHYQAEDFWFDVDPNGVYDDKWYTCINPRVGFTQQQVYESSNSSGFMSYLLTSATDILSRYPSKSLVAHRSCMEDIGIYDKNDNTLLLYIDLPMWLIASCHALINVHNTESF